MIECGVRHIAMILVLGTLLGAPNESLGAGQEPGAVATTPLFAFYSDFATNLNDELIAAGAARRRSRSELFQTGPERECVDALPAAERTAWNRAVDYYAEIISPSGTFGREQMLLRTELAGRGDREERAENQRFVEIAGSFRAAAAPAYESCRWATQNTENRRWIDGLTPRLAAHEEAIARRLQRLYQTPWHGLPLRVDVVPAALSNGASSIIYSPAGGHILISSLAEGNQGANALEIVFHEASHTVAAGWRGDPLPQALDEAAQSVGVPAPDDLWHALLFYTTGETVRAVLDEAGETYAPYLYQGSFFERAWPHYQDAIEATWPAYVNGGRTLSEAASDLIRALRVAGAGHESALTT